MIRRLRALSLIALAAPIGVAAAQEQKPAAAQQPAAPSCPIDLMQPQQIGIANISRQKVLNAKSPDDAKKAVRDASKLLFDDKAKANILGRDYLLAQYLTLAIEHNGEVFTCDHFVCADHKLGNVLEMHEAGMAFSERQKAFGFARRDTLPHYCRQCPHLKLCWSECPRNRCVRTPDGPEGEEGPAGEAELNYLCPGLKQFYRHIAKDMPEILRRVRGG